MNTELEMIWFHWNILEVSENLVFFVGMRVKADIKSPYVFRHSTAIKSFDEATGIRITESGRVYQVQDPPRDPKVVIRALVKQILPTKNYRFRYEFISIQDYYVHLAFE